MNFLNLRFWFDFQATAFEDTVSIILLSLFALSLIFSLGVKIYLRVKRHDLKKQYVLRRSLQRMMHTSFWFSIIGIILFWFRYEEAKFLAMRFWFLLLFVLTAINKWRIVYFYYQGKKRNEASEDENHKRKTLRKYLPEFQKKK